jgi:hypothetical protein
LERSAIYVPCKPAEAERLLEVDIRHPVGFFEVEKYYLKRVDKLPEELFGTGHFGHGLGSDATRSICCGQSVDFKSATPGRIHLQVFVYCHANALSAPPNTPLLISDDLDHVILVVPAYGTSVQHLGKFTISTSMKRYTVEGSVAAGAPRSQPGYTDG